MQDQGYLHVCLIVLAPIRPMEVDIADLTAVVRRVQHNISLLALATHPQLLGMLGSSPGNSYII